MHFICLAGGLLVGAPEEVPRSSMLSEADLQYYVSCYEKSGFRLAMAPLFNSADAFHRDFEFSRQRSKSDVCMSLHSYPNKKVAYNWKKTGQTWWNKKYPFCPLEGHWTGIVTWTEMRSGRASVLIQRFVTFVKMESGNISFSLTSDCVDRCCFLLLW